MEAERLEPHGLDPRTVAALVDALAPLGCEVASAGAADLAVPDPPELAVGRRSAR